MISNSIPPPTSEEKAFVLIIQSRLTLVIGLVMLVIGVAAGYLLRPVLSPAAAPTLAPTQVAQIVVTVIVPTSAQPTANPTVTPLASDVNQAPTPNPSNQALMDALNAQTRHFKGDPAAPVTVIEFGDFQ